ncbi:universal stress protein [Edwardsiella anguillarum]|nr:universal stress protein [Edwardsiella anguillarum]
MAHLGAGNNVSSPHRLSACAGTNRYDYFPYIKQLFFVTGSRVIRLNLTIGPIGETIMYRNILVLLDLKTGSQEDIQLLSKGVQLGGCLQATLHPVHVVLDIDPGDDGGNSPYFSQLEDQATALQQTVGAACPEITIMISNDFSASLEDFIQQQQIDLVILGHHNSAFAQKFVSFLSVAKNTIDAINIDTLIVPLKVTESANPDRPGIFTAGCYPKLTES